MLKFTPKSSIKVAAVIIADRQRLDAEASGAGSCHGVVNGVEERHPAEAEQDDEYDRKRDIDEVGYGGAVPYPGDELADLRTRDLCAHDVHTALFGEREHCHDENKDAHAAYPV